MAVGREMDEAELVAWGEAMGRQLEAPTVIALRGDLGAGKTTLARAIARGAGVRGPMPSPTYNLLFRYPAPDGRSVVHLDLYRLERPDEVWELGWSELPGPNEIVLIEWPSRAEHLLPLPRWEFELRETDSPHTRRVLAVAQGGPTPVLLPGAAA